MSSSLIDISKVSLKALPNNGNMKLTVKATTVSFVTSRVQALASLLEE